MNYTAGEDSVLDVLRQTGNAVLLLILNHYIPHRLLLIFLGFLFPLKLPVVPAELLFDKVIPSPSTQLALNLSVEIRFPLKDF